MVWPSHEWHPWASHSIPKTSMIRVFFLETIVVAMILRCSHGHVTEERHTFGRGTGHEPRNYGIGRVDRHPNVTRSGT